MSSERSATAGGVRGLAQRLRPSALAALFATPLARRTGRALGVLTVAVVGSAIGTALAPPVAATVGPVRLDVRVVPSLQPGVHLLLPPAGRVSFATHMAPVAIKASVSEVDLDGARAVIVSPARLRALQARAPDALRTATLQAGALSAGFAVAGAAALSLLVYRARWWRTAQVAATVTGVLVLTGTLAGITFDSDRFAQPAFAGLLSQAPYVARQTSSLVQRLESYRSGLADIVQSITTLYGTSGDLPVIPGAVGNDVITLLHVSDLHLNPLGLDLTERLVRQFGVKVVLDTGDITTWGTEVESATLARIKEVGVPYVFVRGNHDSALTQRAVAANPNAVVLDGRVVDVAGLVFAGLGDPRFTPDSPVAPTAAGGVAGAVGASATTAGPTTSGVDPELIAGRQLAAIVRAWDAAHPQQPVDLAAFHEPAGTPPLDGLVPLVLAGHVHTRSVRLSPAGTRLMIEGSTGGAGFDSLKPGRGERVPLTATVLYFARQGARARQLVAYDEVTVGGFGLASASLQRTVVRPGSTPALVPGRSLACAGSSVTGPATSGQTFPATSGATGTCPSGTP